MRGLHHQQSRAPPALAGATPAAATHLSKPSFPSTTIHHQHHISTLLPYRPVISPWPRGDFWPTLALTALSLSFRKADSVGDLGKQAVSQDSAGLGSSTDSPPSGSSSAALRAKLTRTNSSASPYQHAIDSVEAGHAQLSVSADILAPKAGAASAPNLGRRSTFKSLRPSSSSLFDDPNRAEDSATYETARVLRTAGYRLESPLDPLDDSSHSLADSVLAYDEWLRKYFIDQSSQVFHYVPSGSSVGEFVIISVVKSFSSKDPDNLRSVRAILSTPARDTKLVIKGSALRGSKDDKSSHKSAEKEKEKEKKSGGLLKGGGKLSERKLLAYIRPGLGKKKVKRIDSNRAILDGLATLSRVKLGYLHADRKFKIGVVYWKGHLLEEQTLSLNEASPAFEDFLSLLGDRCELNGFKGFTGGLDTQKQDDGKIFVHTPWQNGEIVFHVSTLLAGTPHQRKVHIGNDAVVIVFVDSKDHFSPEYIHSKFNQVFIVVQVAKEDEVAAKYTEEGGAKRSGRSKTKASGPNASKVHSQSPSDKKNRKNSVASKSDASSTATPRTEGPFSPRSGPSEEGPESPRSPRSPRTPESIETRDRSASISKSTSPTTRERSRTKDRASERPRSPREASGDPDFLTSPRSPSEKPDKLRRKASSGRLPSPKAEGESGGEVGGLVLSASASDFIGAPGGRRSISAGGLLQSSGSSDHLNLLAALSKNASDRRSVLLNGLGNIFEQRESGLDSPSESRRGSLARKRTGTHYRVTVIQREGVPTFAPRLPFPYPIFKKGNKFREFLLNKATTALIASYQSPNFQERILFNRRSYFENLAKSLAAERVD